MRANSRTCSPNPFVAGVGGASTFRFTSPQAARVVIDDWAQASHSGEINVPLSKGLLKKEQIYGSLGEIVAGKKPGRTSAQEITVFDSTGLVIQDLALGYAVYLRAKERGLGEEKDFLK